MGAVDQAEFMTAAFGPDRSLWQAPVGFFAPSSPFASEVGMAALSGPRDYAKVRKDLEAAGYRGEAVVFLASTQPFFKEWSSVAAEMMRRVGMNVDYQVMDLAASLQRRASKKPPGEGGWSALVAALSGVVASSPATHVALRGNGDQAPLWGWPSSPKIEALRDEWLDATDLVTQKKLAAEMQAQAFIDVPYYPLGINFNPIALRSDLTGALTASGAPLFWNVRKQA
jgi:peptide/nickel transport system substrate-binding protein